MKILLAEDNTKLGKLIVHMLKKECHSIDWVLDGNDAIEYANASEYDLLILDWMLPGTDGVNVCKQLRAQGFARGVIMLTAKDALSDRIMGLDAGADDYVVKPFEFEELFARIRSLSRRVQHPLAETVIAVPPYTLKTEEHAIYRNDIVIPLTVREYQLMEMLMRHLGKPINREMLMSHIWGLDGDVTNNSLDALVKLLRKKLDKDPHIEVQNVRGVGYKLEVKNVL
jgi:DNA-binding response OmpR family regulator